MSPGDVFTLLQNGGPLALLAFVISAWLWERRETRKLTQQVIDLATAQVEAQAETKALLQSLKDVLTQVLNRL